MTQSSFIKVTLLSLVLPFAWSKAYCNSTIYINELMQSNIDCIMDDLNEFPDSWVELYNPEQTDADISGYALSLESDGSEAYILPEGTIVPAEGYLLLYCDKQGEGLHATFRIDSGKGSLYLFDSTGHQVDGIKSIKKQPAPNIAYGRVQDGDSEWGYQLTPTPGQSNQGGVSDQILDAPLFSIQGGVWNEIEELPLELTLPSSAPEGAYIKYTLDGKEPSMEEGELYSDTIRINSSVAVRAKVFADGCISIPSAVQSYIFLGREQTIPLVSITIDPDYLYDDVIGIFVEGIGGTEAPNYTNDWRRSMNLEYFLPEDSLSVINQLCEGRVQGGATRSHGIKSMAIYANKRFGVKRFTQEFWPEDKPGITDNKSIVLHNGGNDFGRCYIKDALSQRLIGRHADVDWMGYKPVNVYINGKYYAMLGLRERSNEDNVYANHNGEEDIDIWENLELKEGNSATCEEFVQWFDTYGETATLDEWNERMYLEEYTSFFIANIWVANKDFPHNNFMMWRPQAEGSRWRFIHKDMDNGFTNDTDTDYFEHLVQQVHRFTRMFRHLLANPEYPEYFLKHWIAYTGDFLKASTVEALLDEIKDECYDELKITDDIWNSMNQEFSYKLTMPYLWAQKRETQVIPSIQKQFELGEAVSITIQDKEDFENLEKIYYDGIPLVNRVFEGVDYVGRTLEVSADISEESLDILTGWEVRIGEDSPIYIPEEILTWNITEEVPLVITPVYNGAGITSIAKEQPFTFDRLTGTIQTSDTLLVYDIQGRLVLKGSGTLQLPHRGCYIIANKKVFW
ncbi:MAG: CotH kinase family protein [Bacteroidales bacterium]|nr:CotH kinase family protein [Bacteroidales bacterium]